VHELSLAAAVIDHALDSARGAGLDRVRRVEVSVGAGRLVVPEALRTAFEVLSENTLVAGADLVVREEPLRAICEACGDEYTPCIEDYTCPGCGRAAARIVGGRDVVLTSLSGECDSDASPSEVTAAPGSPTETS